MTNIVFFTGAGISHESGLKTFRGEDGLWNGYRIEDVCTLEAYQRHPERVIAFYNERRRDVLAAEPNAAHRAIADLENQYDNLIVITQNVDDLHERAGSSVIYHVHGEIMKKRSDADEEQNLVDCRDDIRIGDVAPDGGQYRPHVVFFGEDLPIYELYCARMAASAADILIVSGTSLEVNPAARIPRESGAHTIIVVDPAPPVLTIPGKTVVAIASIATQGIPEAIERIRAGEFKGK